jgi:hypothetical protein
VVVAVPLPLEILRVQAKQVVRVVAQLETMVAMEVQRLDWEHQVKDLMVGCLQYWLHGQAVVAVDHPV